MTIAIVLSARNPLVLTTSKESVTIAFPTAALADELLSHVLECGALGGR
jgi:hypothetical protein